MSILSIYEVFFLKGRVTERCVGERGVGNREKDLLHWFIPLGQGQGEAGSSAQGSPKGMSCRCCPKLCLSWETHPGRLMRLGPIKR